MLLELLFMAFVFTVGIAFFFLLVVEGVAIFAKLRRNTKNIYTIKKVRSNERKVEAHFKVIR